MTLTTTTTPEDALITHESELSDDAKYVYAYAKGAYPDAGRFYVAGLRKSLGVSRPRIELALHELIENAFVSIERGFRQKPGYIVLSPKRRAERLHAWAQYRKGKDLLPRLTELGIEAEASNNGVTISPDDLSLLLSKAGL